MVQTNNQYTTAYHLVTERDTGIYHIAMIICLSQKLITNRKF